MILRVRCIKNCKNALKHLKDDNKLLFRASSQAQKATDYILQRDENGVPKYLHNLLKTATNKTPGTTKKKATIRKEVAAMSAPEIEVDLSPIKEVTLTLPTKTATVVATSVATLQQNEIKEITTTNPVNAVDSAVQQTRATTLLQQKTIPLQQKINFVATKEPQVAITKDVME
ncbi:hypothetical protein CXF68_20225 [Tenacibaculum sp. Bg11-29]|uniref:hypothetical protein n=1 Tax=Tenacibaculum sp. Bg11-29 TaxID=2058306 RepID=UPI000C329683|nr:hypothetical protein [Tenacibaculum sp. Bg11-29]PKH52882.1 hypothetical protein CXF68_20225 [Tenacibaculum sp. Bg11-29]